jgi:hypothetical protein
MDLVTTFRKDNSIILMKHTLSSNVQEWSAQSQIEDEAEGAGRKSVEKTDG